MSFIIQIIFLLSVLQLASSFSMHRFGVRAVAGLHQATSSYKLTRAMSMSDKATAGIALLVNLEIKHERIDEFMKVMKADAVGSRENENGGCLRFEVMRNREEPNKFTLYEVYKDDAAVEFHKATPHYKLWMDFKAEGGVVAQSVVKCDPLFFPDTN